MVLKYVPTSVFPSNVKVSAQNIPCNDSLHRCQSGLGFMREVPVNHLVSERVHARIISIFNQVYQRGTAFFVWALHFICVCKQKYTAAAATRRARRAKQRVIVVADGTIQVFCCGILDQIAWPCSTAKLTHFLSREANVGHAQEVIAWPVDGLYTHHKALSGLMSSQAANVQHSYFYSKRVVCLQSIHGWGVHAIYTSGMNFGISCCYLMIE